MLYSPCLLASWHCSVFINWNYFRRCVCVLFEVEQKQRGKSVFTRVFLTERWKVPVKESKLCFINMIYIYIYAFSRCFYPKRLTIAFRQYIFYQYVCSLGIEPTTFCAANTMLYHWATQEHIYIYAIAMFTIVYSDYLSVICKFSMALISSLSSTNVVSGLLYHFMSHTLCSVFCMSWLSLDH